MTRPSWMLTSEERNEINDTLPMDAVVRDYETRLLRAQAKKLKRWFEECGLWYDKGNGGLLNYPEGMLIPAEDWQELEQEVEGGDVLSPQNILAQVKGLLKEMFAWWSNYRYYQPGFPGFHWQKLYDALCEFEKVERGKKDKDLRILLPTLCRGNGHVWLWPSYSALAPQPEQRCTCGLYQWDEYQRELEGKELADES